MNRFRTYGPNDDQPAALGDGAFVGVDARRDPGQLEDGLVAWAENCRFTQGIVEPRRGIRKLSFGANGYLGDSPETIRPYPAVVDAETFQDPIGGEEWLIVATVDGVFRTRPGQHGTPIGFPAGQAIPAGSKLIQTYNGMVLLRGAAYDPLYMADLDAGFSTLPTPSAGKQKIPPSSQGIYFQNRLVTVDARDAVAYRDGIFVSDIGAVTSVLQGDSVFNQFKVNQGSADRLVGVFKFNDTTLIAAKERSIYVVTDVYGDNTALANNAKLDQVTAEYGCKAPRSFVQVGQDVWFLAFRRGVASIRQTETNALQGVDTPVSRDIHPLIDRINWEWAAGAVGATWGNRVYFAVPLDNSRVNNAVLVYDTVTQRWAGVDKGPAIAGVVSWVRFTYAGEVRLGFFSTDGYLNLYEDGFLDQVGDASGVITSGAVPMLVRTRGYGGLIAGRKLFESVRMAVSTWWPTYSITAIVEGVREERAVRTGATTDRAKFTRPFNADPYRTGNQDDNFHAPYREDYSIDPATPIVTGSNGLSPDLHQEFEISYWLRETGRWVQFELETTRGRCELRGVLVDNRRGFVRDGATS